MGYRFYLTKRIFATALYHANRLGRGMTVNKSLLGRRLPLHLHDYGQCFFYCGVPTEPDNEDLLSALGQHLGGDLIDIGANYGQMSFNLLGKFRRMALVEPNPEAAAFLRTLFANRDNVSVLEAGAGETAGQGTFRLGEGQQSGLSTISTDGNGSLRITTIDEIVSSLGLSPSAIKIDIEGFEEKILRGAAATIEKHKPVIAWEVRSPEQFESCSSLLPGWRFYRIDSGVIQGVSIAKQIPAIVLGLFFGPWQHITEIHRVSRPVSLVFAAHQQKCGTIAQLSR